MKLGDILVICLLVLLFWGPSRLSGLGKGIGDGIRNFRKGLRGDEGLQKADPDRRDVPKS
jgi:TatA/E family protein of Tat protein translocase